MKSSKILSLFFAIGLLCSSCVSFVYSSDTDTRSLAETRREGLEELFLRQGPSVRLSTVYNSLPEEQRYALMARVKKLILANIPPDILNNPAVGQLPPEVQAVLPKLIMLIKAASPEQMEAFVQTQDLDHLLPLPPAVARLYHGHMTKSAIPGGTLTREEQLEADRADQSAWMDQVLATEGYSSSVEGHLQEIALLDENCDDGDFQGDVPQNHVENTDLQGLVKASYVIEAEDTVLVNSVRLAKALNHLTNPIYRQEPLKVSLFGKEVSVRDGVSLFEHICATGRYDVVLYDARMFVDFLGYSVAHGEDYLPVKIPTWIATDIDPSDPEKALSQEASASGSLKPSYITPANHSEHLLVFFEKGTTKPAILVRWYMGLPSSSSGLKQGTRFKAAVWQRCSWSGYRCVRSYEALDASRQMLRAGSTLMQLFNFLQWRYRYPMNGYGVLSVCQDTTALMEVILNKTAAQSTVWPLYRDPSLDFYYIAALETLGLSLGPSGSRGEILNVPSDARPDLYPWTQDRKVTLKRVGYNVPTRNPETLHFPVVKEGTNILSAKSPTFDRALKARD